MKRRFGSVWLGISVLCVLTVACDRTDPLTIYSGRSENLIDPIILEFEDRTGVDVQVKYGKTSNLAITLLEEGPNSPADVFFAQDPGGLGAVEDLLSRLPEATFSMVPEYARSSEGKWVGVSGRARTLVYNTESLTGTDMPDGLEGLLEPQWRGRVGWAPRNGSFQTMVTAMRALWGEDRTRGWLEGMLANDVHEYDNNTSQVVAVASGEIEVGLVNHYYLQRFIAVEGAEYPARNYHVRDGGPGALVMVAGAGILSTTDQHGDAVAFLNFLLSDVGQQYFVHETHEYPLVPGMAGPQGLIRIEEINQPSIPLTELADLEGTTKLLRDVGVIP